jgi:hypothetical protein
MLAEIIMSGALIGMPAHVVSVDADANTAHVVIMRPPVKMTVHSLCPVSDLEGLSVLHFMQLLIKNGRIYGFARECPV